MLPWNVRKSFKFSGVCITKDLTKTSNLVGKAQRRLYAETGPFTSAAVNRLWPQHNGKHPLLRPDCVVSWLHNHRTEGRVVKAVQWIIEGDLPNMDAVYTRWHKTQASRIIRDKTPRSYQLFDPWPSGKTFRTIRLHINRPRNSFSPGVVVSITPLQTQHSFRLVQEL